MVWISACCGIGFMTLFFSKIALDLNVNFNLLFLNKNTQLWFEQSVGINIFM